MWFNFCATLTRSENNDKLWYFDEVGGNHDTILN